MVRWMSELPFVGCRNLSEYAPLTVSCTLLGACPLENMKQVFLVLFFARDQGHQAVFLGKALCGKDFKAQGPGIEANMENWSSHGNQ